MDKVKEQRKWMKSYFVEMDAVPTDQYLGLPQPPLTKPYGDKEETINLPKVTENLLAKANILEIINNRKSNRSYTNSIISLEELSFLLWSTQGVKDIKGDNYATIRTVPSAGARHPFETYLAISRVEGLKRGVYRYLPLTHQLLLIFEEENLEEKVTELTLGQKFAGKAAVTFIWSVVPYRGEWRYNLVAHKAMLLDAGHVCQNLYIACEAINCGTCAIAAYDQNNFDSFLKLNGEDEFVVYLAPVGKLV